MQLLTTRKRDTFVRFEALNDGMKNTVFSDVKPFNLVIVLYLLVRGISANHSCTLDLFFRFFSKRR
jgi:copper oxidase (laccase) domain-containing protein